MHQDSLRLFWEHLDADREHLQRELSHLLLNPPYASKLSPRCSLWITLLHWTTLVSHHFLWMRTTELHQQWCWQKDWATHCFWLNSKGAIFQSVGSYLTTVNCPYRRAFQQRFLRLLSHFPSLASMAELSYIDMKVPLTVPCNKVRAGNVVYY